MVKKIELSDQAKGLFLVTTGALFFTADALLLMLPELGFWDLTFFRYLFSFVPLTLFLIWRYNGVIGLANEIRAIKGYGLLAGIILSTSSMSFVLATRTVGAANTLVVYSGMPMISAVLEFIIFKDRPRKVTWVAIVIAISCIVFVVSSQLGSTAGSGGSKVGGNVAAIVCVTGFAFYFIIGRIVAEKYNKDTIVAIVISNALSVLFSLAMGAKPWGVQVISWDVFYLFIEGFCICPMSFSFETMATQYITAAEIGLVLLLEVVGGPMWVWAILNVMPTIQEFVGGGILVTTLALHSVWIMYHPRSKKNNEIKRQLYTEMVATNALEPQSNAILPDLGATQLAIADKSDAAIYPQVYVQQLVEQGILPVKPESDASTTVSDTASSESVSSGSIALEPLSLSANPAVDLAVLETGQMTADMLLHSNSISDRAISPIVHHIEPTEAAIVFKGA